MKLGEFKDLARVGIAGAPLVSKRKVKGRIFEAEMDVHGLSMDDDLPIVSIDLDKRDGGGMEASRAKIDEWPTLPDEVEGFKPGELAVLGGRSKKTRISDDDLAKLFERRTDDGKGARKALVVRPDIPRTDVRLLPPTETITAASMARSRAALLDFADMPDEDDDEA